MPEAIHEVYLEGCHVTPLAGYLKALAVLRLVAEQADARAQAAWRGETFVLRSRLDRDALISFFLDEYVPTPVVSPWNGGTGLAAKDPKDAQEAIQAVEQSADPRLESYRRVVEQIRAWRDMPQDYQTVGELCETPESLIDDRRPGKQRDKRRRLHEAERRAREAAQAVFGEAVSSRTRLDWIQQTLKEEKGQKKRVLSAWWKAVKKLQTEYSSRDRKESKEQILRLARARLPDETLPWLDATYALRADDAPYYPPLLGTGGNDGKLEFSSHFMRRLVDVLGAERDRDASARLLEAALFGELGTGLPEIKIGHFDPGRAGGFNQGAEFETKDFKANPWDLVLSLEGATLLGASIHKRMAGNPRESAAAPFTVDYSGAGFASAAPDDDGKGEVWLPVWRRFVRNGELQQLFREGRSLVGRRPARTGLDFARAVKTLGVARGVDAFERYALVIRRGKSRVALPAGRLPVRFHRQVRLLDDLDPIVERIDQFLRGLSSVPASLKALRRQIDEATLDCARDPNPEHFCTLVMALGGMDRALAQRAASGAKAPPRPLGGLRADWIVVCDDGGPEVRIAAALASIQGDQSRKVGPIRSNLAGVNPAEPWLWSKGRGQRRWAGSSLPERLAGVLQQRLLDAERLRVAETPLRAQIGLSPYDVVPFLYGETDEARIESLLWGFGLVVWRRDADHASRASLWRNWARPQARMPIPRGYALLKLLHWPDDVRHVALRREPRIVALLQAGRTEDALDVARHRLRIAGLLPLPVAARDEVDPLYLVSALLIPLADSSELEKLVLVAPLEKKTPEGTSAAPATPDRPDLPDSARPFQSAQP